MTRVYTPRNKPYVEYRRTPEKQRYVELLIERNRMIATLYLETRHTLQEISDIFDITRERVRQIVKKASPTRPPNLKHRSDRFTAALASRQPKTKQSLKRAAIAARKEARRQRCLEMCELRRQGWAYADIAARYGIAIPNVVRKVLTEAPELRGWPYSHTKKYQSRRNLACAAN